MISSALAVAVLAPNVAFGAVSDLKVGGWIPYWQKTMGTESAIDNLEKIDTAHPFVFTVKSDGTLNDLGDIEGDVWEDFSAEAKKENVEVIPSVMTSDGDMLHAILSNPSLRQAHIDAIVEMVEDGNFDGVDIDYEGKRAVTNPFFSLFLLQLKVALIQSGDKTLSCTSEPRTPPESLYRDVPATLERANDYTIIGVVCDRVQIMAYDQQRADIKLNEERKGEPYMPVADIDWVRKVAEYTVKEGIPKNKIMLGIPTYGYHYVVNVSPDWYRSYERIGALNLPDIEDVADDYDVEAGRLAGGELNYSYFPESSVFKILNALPTPEGTRKGNEAAAKALLFSNATGMDTQVRIVTYQDAQAVQDKVKLADQLGFRGVVLFKIDGEEDEDIWDLF